MTRRLFLFASLFGLIAGCAAPASSIPTPYPPEYLPTVVALTADAIAQATRDSATAAVIASSLPTETEAPTVTPTRTRPPTRTPTLSPTPKFTHTPTAIPGHELAFIQFIAPGPMSRLISPINLRMNISSGESKRVQVDLFGEDGRLISRTVKRNVPQSRDGLYQGIKISFEIPSVSEVGRITVSTFDEEGRIQYLNSIRVLLLSSGDNEINPVGNPSEPVGVTSPSPKETVSGGVLTVRGDVWPFNLQPVIMELISPDGKSIGLRVLTVESLNPFAVDTTIPYKISEPTLARLTIRQDDDRIPGLTYLYSQLVQLNP